MTELRHMNNLHEIQSKQIVQTQLTITTGNCIMKLKTSLLKQHKKLETVEDGRLSGNISVTMHVISFDKK